MGPSPSPAWIPFPTAVYRAAAPRRSRPPPIRAVPGALPPSLRPYLGLVGVELERIRRAELLQVLQRIWVADPRPLLGARARPAPGAPSLPSLQRASFPPHAFLRGCRRAAPPHASYSLPLASFASAPPWPWARGGQA